MKGIEIMSVQGRKGINFALNQVAQLSLVLISLVLYSIAPFSFSLQYCIYCAAIFTISAILVIRLSFRQSRSFINFDILFTIPFFYTNYVYCLFLYGDNPYFSLFNLDFNENYICKGAALSSLAYCCYALGRSVIKKSPKPRNLIIKYKSYNAARTFFFVIAVFFILFSLVPNIGKTYEEGSAAYGIGDYIMPFVIILIYFILAVNLFSHKTPSLKYTFNSDKSFYIIVITILALFSIEGARTFIMRIGIYGLFLYDACCRRIKAREALFILVLGFVFMAIVGVFRSGDQAASEAISDNPVIQAGQDLIINNRSQYVLMEYVDKHGFSYGKTMLMNLFSTIPFLQSIIFATTDLSVWNTNSAYLVTDLYYSGRADDKIVGLGTNLVGDVYLLFGIIGLVVIMYLLGRIISNVTQRVVKGDFISIMIYGMFICNAVYYTRSSILTPLRETCWLLFIYYMISGSSSKSQSNDKQPVINE